MESDVRLVRNGEPKVPSIDLTKSAANTPGLSGKKKKYESLVVVMSHKEYNQVEEEYDKIRI